jgi:hypothetical protein
LDKTFTTNQSESGKIEEKKAIFRAYQVIWYSLYVVQTFLLFRFFFKLFAANPGSPFVKLIYSVSSALISPFRAIFPTPVFENMVFEWVTLVAIVVYWVIAYTLVYLFQLIKPINKKEVEQVVDNQ